MRCADLDRVLAIEADLFGDDAWSKELFRSELVQTGTRCYLLASADPGQAADREEVLGYAGLAACPDQAMIQTLAVRRDRWGHGAGTALLTALLDQARRRGLLRVELEVRADNPRARRLYERFGFAAVRVRRGYYQPSGVDAIVMIREARRQQPTPARVAGWGA
jgi:ribosomal-protein-alanine N-acetyltransferase